MFLENYKFKYPWRKYQENVLAELESHMHDDKLNIVAAPGSGKTILGLEIVRRLNKHVLILSPTLTIKNQWVDRFLTMFTDEKQIPDFISKDIYQLNRFNVATYQGLHFAHGRKQIKEEAFELQEEETTTTHRGTNVDYDLIAELKKNKIEVIVLDEAHHLRSAWWKSLTTVLKALPNIKTIALTATPPYDVDKSEWDKYVEICGPVDCEISIPELVATKDLCPHQDFVVFNRLSKTEEDEVLKIQTQFDTFVEKLKANQELTRIISMMPELNRCDEHEEIILENPKYYSSLIIFLNAIGTTPDKKIIRLLGGKTPIPKLDMNWFEIMLQGLLFEDKTLLAKHSETLNAIKGELEKIGGIEKRRVTIVNCQKLKKLMASSMGKMESIIEIAHREATCLKSDLSMVVLTDYIRREALEQEDYQKIGVIPIFRKLIGSEIDANVAVLTGSLQIIPEKLVPYMKEKLPECNFEEIGMAGYVQVKANVAFKNRVVNLITEAINEKKLNIVVGTVALLGEGWDCQAVNSLVLASFVGSFMLSNQMRGRAIRKSKNDPNKVANIWHLVSVTRVEYKKNQLFSTMELADYHTLKRRFKGFVGIAYHEDVIQNGLDRLEMIDESKLPKQYDKVNQTMFEHARNRKRTKERWEHILALFGDDEIKIVNTFQGNADIPRFKQFAFYDLERFFWSLVLTVFIVLFALFGNLTAGEAVHSMTLVMSLLLIIWDVYLLFKIVGHYNPIRNMEKIGKATLATLHELGKIKTSLALVSVHTEKVTHQYAEGGMNHHSTSLRGATVYENNLYIRCLDEIYKRVDNPRYVIKTSSLLGVRSTYFNVPSQFGNNKTNAEIFYKYWKKYIRKGLLIYTRNADGRIVLMDARKGSFDYNDRFFERKRARRKDDWK